ncbi:hypothetical protein AS188_07580 [Kocuria flava]|uniref:Uncharacterized protein n=1 Tax=Kocuria flava TaxID=446860 RepID=A0A0U2WT59_9MICC|nr:hypothetical protein [Kocuria flava]ALU39636.1 hypothetical protein AS188_07580 [Kocuria flava]GEO92012.1 hypothetical protein KFL01_13180 [Kocuria flava]
MRPAETRSPAERPTTTDPRTLPALCWAIAVLATVAALAGLLWPAGPGPFPVETVRGERVELAGTGLYFYDTLFTAAGSRGTDLVTLVLGVPLLVLCTLRFRRGAPWAGPLLLGTLGFFLYVHGGYALGAVAYHRLFLLSVVLFSATLYTFVLLFAALVRRGPERLFPPGTPRRGPVVLLAASAVVLVVVWGAPLLAAAVTGAAPGRLGPYTVPFTHALDLAVLVPATVWGAVLIARGRPLGYVIACAVLVLEVFLAPLIAVQTVLQLRAGVVFTVPEIVGPVAGFLVLAVAAAAVLWGLLRPLGRSTVPASGFPPASGGRSGTDRPRRGEP